MAQSNERASNEWDQINLEGIRRYVEVHKISGSVHSQRDSALLLHFIVASVLQISVQGNDLQSSNNWQRPLPDS